MKKVLDWLLNAAAVVFAAIILAPLALRVLFFILLFIAINTAALDGLTKSEPAVASLEATQLAAYVDYAPYCAKTLDDTLTAFEMPWYNNHADNTDLREGLMQLIAITDSWHVETVAPEDYAARIPTKAAFLLPDVTFEAWYASSEGTAFFDQETGLFIHLREGKAPKPGTIRADKLTIPHNGYLYELETHGGFHGDGTTFYALIVPEEKRADFEATLATHADWHAGTITHAEYIHLHNHEFYSVPGLYPADDVTFDWWCYVNTYARAHPDFVSEYTPDNSDFPAVMQQAGARPAGNWLLALYDPDTGLFIYYAYDS